MKLLVSWLREFINPKVADEDLAEHLTMLGLEVSNVKTIAPQFSGVVVGSILQCSKHPNADKLNLCMVNIGSQTLQIICGASNVSAGLKVAVATVGSILPNDLKIKKAKLRGVESFGMICSASELGLVDKLNGIMELSNNAIIGNNIRDELNLDDKIIELDITPNRGDCFSVLGVARELSANYNIKLDKLDYSTDIASNLSINANIKNDKYCPKYLIKSIEGIDNSVTTPEWITRKLIHSGQLLHSAVVDITNFVLLELGQPLHSYDTNKIDGDICVRLADNNEEITLLNEQQVKLKDDTLIIADNKKPLAIAGIMGGLISSTQTTTTNIILESAFFDNTLIAGKARNYGLHTESSLRFERGVDFNITELAINRATQLIVDICGGKIGKTNSIINKNNLPILTEITLKYTKISNILGFDLDKEWINKKFKYLGFKIIAQNKESITIIPPSFRFDIYNQVDLIEELARLYGYDNLPVQSFKASMKLKSTKLTNQYSLSNILVHRGYNEVITYSFISDDMSNLTSDNKIKLQNPISTDMSIMRTSIIPGLLKTAVDNINRGQCNLRIFEGWFLFYGININEQTTKIAGLVTGADENNWSSKTQEINFFDIKADVIALLGSGNNIDFVACEHELLQKGQSSKILLNGQQIGILGAISTIIEKKLSLNKIYIFELYLSPLLVKNTLKYRKLSNYQSSSRDISILLDKNIEYYKLINSIKSLKQRYLINVKLLDVYDDGINFDKKSLTLNLKYQADDKTLTVDEIENSVNQILQLLIRKYKVQQR